MPYGDWILILTLFYNGPSVTVITNFPTKQECLVAGDAWLKQVNETFNVGKALCVHRGEDQ